MHIYIVGICGTFMAGIATIAKALGFEVSGCDHQVYPPMSDVLAAKGIAIDEGYQLPKTDVDLYVIGNAAKRGMPIIEDILSQKLPFQSGPEWLYDNVLSTKRVLAIAGTHGKTTTSSLLAWVLEYCGLEPSFLIGGVPQNFNSSARLTAAPFFVIEADEYDTAFFDKRSKLVHYRPEIAVVNNLEFDHADIFNSIFDIQKQLHGMIRLMAKDALLVYRANTPTIEQLLDMGAWSQLLTIGDEQGLHAKLRSDDARSFDVFNGSQYVLSIDWSLIGAHNIENALAVVAVCRQLQLPMDKVSQAFTSFKNTKRRMELKKVLNGVEIYDDFAHHPTAIASTLKGFQQKINFAEVAVIIEFGSFTMRSGQFFDEVLQALDGADRVFLLNTPKNKKGSAENHYICDSVEHLCQLIGDKPPFSHILVMSNKDNQLLFKELYRTLGEKG